MEKDLKWIKNKYGEKMRDICRSEFPTLLEVEGLLPSILEEYFYAYHSLGHDIEVQDKIESFKYFILSNVTQEEEKRSVDTSLSAVELLDKAGYILYPECKTEEDIQSFRHYYFRGDGKVPVYTNGSAPTMYHGEELCTFNGSRLSSCRVWFAVKKNVDEIKRENFENPDRQDEYGTSVISIQFTRGKYSTLSIKNRYNHTVKNPDNTFNSKLDNIIFGLSDAFERDYGVKNTRANTRSDFELENYVYANDGKMYPYNMEINNVYYCPDNIIIDNFEVKKFDKSHQVLVDYFIVDTKDGSVCLYDKNIKDSFVDILEGEKKIILEKDGIIFKKEDGSCTNIKLNKRKEIVGIENSKLEYCGNNFLFYNKSISNVELPKLKYIGQGFLYNNKLLKEINLPLVEKFGHNFLLRNIEMRKLNMPSLKICGDNFLCSNLFLSELNLSNLEECGEQFLFNNIALANLDLPNLIKCNRDFLYSNKSIKKVNLPRLQTCGDNFLMELQISELSLPKLEECGSSFFGQNNNLVRVDLPNLKECGAGFLCFNNLLRELSLPELKKCGDRFLFFNNTIVEMNLSNLSKCGNRFMHYNNCLKKIDLTNLYECGEDFLMYNNSLMELSLPNLHFVGPRFMKWNYSLKKIYIPNLRYNDYTFLCNNTSVRRIKKQYKLAGGFGKVKSLVRKIYKGNTETQKEL